MSSSDYIRSDINLEVVSFKIEYKKILSASHAKPYMNLFGNDLHVPSTQNNNLKNQFISISIIVDIFNKEVFSWYRRR